MGLQDKVTEAFDGCHLCLGLYKTPKILHCLHSFCAGCLEEELEKSEHTNRLICSSCRQVTHLRYRGIQGLTTNRFIVRKQYVKGLQLHIESNQSSSGESVDEGSSSGSDADVSSEAIDTMTQLPDSIQQPCTKDDVNLHRVNPSTPPISAPANYFDFSCSAHKTKENLRTTHLRNELEDKAMNLRSEILGVTDSMDVINQYVNNWIHRKSELRSKIQHRSFILQKQIQDEEAMLLEQLHDHPAEKEFLSDAKTKKQDLHASLKASLQAIAFTRQILSEGTEEEINELGYIVKQRLQRNVHENVFLNIPEFKLDHPETSLSKIVSEMFGEILQTTSEKKIYSPQRFYEIYHDEDPDDDLQVFETETIMVSKSDFSKIKSPSFDKNNQINVKGLESPAKRPENIALEFVPNSTEHRGTSDKEQSYTFNRYMNLRSSIREKRNRILRAYSDSSNPTSPTANEVYNPNPTPLLAWDAQHALTKLKPRQGVRHHHTFNTVFPTNYETVGSLSPGTSQDSLPSPTVPEYPGIPTNGCRDINGNSQSLRADKQNTPVTVSSVRENIRRRKGTWRSLTLT